MTAAVKRDLQIVQMRNYLDPKRYYKASWILVASRRFTCRLLIHLTRFRRRIRPPFLNNSKWEPLLKLRMSSSLAGSRSVSGNRRLPTLCCAMKASRSA